MKSRLEENAKDDNADGLLLFLKNSIKMYLDQNLFKKPELKLDLFLSHNL